MSDALNGDAAKAEALRIAYDNLKRLGRRFGPEDIGEMAAKIMKAMNKDESDE